MAAVTSGSFTTTSMQSRSLTFSWSRTSYSAANNTSTISWSLKGSGSASGWVGVKVVEVVINGTTVFNDQTTEYKVYNGTTVASGTATIAHNSDGSKTFSASVKAGIYYYGPYQTGSGSWTLPSIPRYATSVQSLKSKTETSITMNWSSDSAIDYIWYSKNGGTNWTAVGSVNAKSGSYTISGLSTNTAYSIKTRVRRKDSQLTTDSSALSVTTYAYPNANSMPNFTIGNSVTIGIYNPLGRSVTVQMKGADNSVIASYTTTKTSVSGFNTTAAINALYQSIPSSRSGTYKIVVTYGSHTSTKNGGTYSVNTANCSPNITSVAYEDTNSATTAITGDNQKIIRNKSIVQYSASGLTAQKGASVSACSVSVNGQTYNLTISGNSATGGNAVIDSGADITAKFTVTDSRGLTATKTVTVTMMDWVLPSAIINIARQDNFYSNCNFTVDALYSSLDGNNTISIAYAATKEGDVSPTVSGTLQDNVPAVVTLDNNYAWTIAVTLTDLFGTTTYSVHLSRGTPIFFVDRIKSSVGINCFPQHNNSLEINNELLADFVIEQGTSGDWTYRKWSSGVAECWCQTGDITLSDYSSTSGFHGYKTDITYPTNLFVSAPVVNYSVTIGQGFALSGTILKNNHSETGSTLYALATASGSQTTNWFVYAVGKWK